MGTPPTRPYLLPGHKSEQWAINRSINTFLRVVDLLIYVQHEIFTYMNLLGAPRMDRGVSTPALSTLSPCSKVAMPNSSLRQCSPSVWS